MKLKLGYLKQFIKLFGLKKGVRLYLNISMDKYNPIDIPSIKHKFELRKDSSDLRTFYQVFVNNEYDIKVPFIPKLIIDGGANIGLFSILMSNRFPDSNIIAIEPDIDNFNVLKRNLDKYHNTKLENAGIWSKNTTLKVYDKFDSGAWGMVVEQSEGGNVNAISINHIIEKYNIEYIDILKLDIETSEKIIFSENFSSWLPKTKMIIIELHDWLMEGCSKTFFTALNLSVSNYELITCGENLVIINNDLRKQVSDV